jgi:hypothetical protein
MALWHVEQLIGRLGHRFGGRRIGFFQLIEPSVAVELARDLRNIRAEQGWASF